MVGVAGYRFALQKAHKGRWLTIASSDDRPLLEKMLNDQGKQNRVSWRLVDRSTDAVLRLHVALQTAQD